MTKMRNRERLVDTWEEIKVIMRKRFVLEHYYQGIISKVTKSD